MDEFGDEFAKKLFLEDDQMEEWEIVENPDAPSVNIEEQELRQGSNGVEQQPSQPQQPQDPQKTRRIQQQLFLLLHAHKCQQRERQEPQDRIHCTLPYCNVMKGMLEHMVTCNFVRQCQYPHCSSSRQIIIHWKTCVKEECPVCSSAKKYTSQKGAAGLFVELLDGQNGQQQMGQQQPTGQQSPGPGPSKSSAGMHMFGSPSNDANVNSLFDGYIQNPNLFHQQMMGQQPTGFGQNNEGPPPPLAPSESREWHASITQDLRNHLIGKLVKAIFPSPDPEAIHDQRIRDLIAYARKVEMDMFELAPTKEAYYHMLAEKIYKIRQELEEKKSRRLNALQQPKQ